MSRGQDWYLCCSTQAPKLTNMTKQISISMMTHLWKNSWNHIDRNSYRCIQGDIRILCRWCIASSEDNWGCRRGRSHNVTQRSARHRCRSTSRTERWTGTFRCSGRADRQNSGRDSSSSAVRKFKKVKKLVKMITRSIKVEVDARRDSRGDLMSFGASWR